MRVACAAGLALALTATIASATVPAQAPPPFPVEIDMAFDLIDTDGRAVSEADFLGRPVALFFGYVSCEAICSTVIPQLVAALDRVDPDRTRIVPVVITVDPARDTTEAMARGLDRWGEGLVGLTGSDEALARARAVFQVEVEQVATAPDGAPIYAHGSYVYLIGRDGRVRALVPPILGVERMAEFIERYFGKAGGGTL